MMAIPDRESKGKTNNNNKNIYTLSMQKSIRDTC